MTLPKGYVSRKAQFVPAFFQAIEDFEYSKKGPMSETTASDHAASALAHGQSDIREVAEAVQKRVDLGKNYNKNINENDVNDDDNNSSSERTNDSKLRRNSLHSSYRSNALQASICQEDLEDEHLVSVN